VDAARLAAYARLFESVLTQPGRDMTRSTTLEIVRRLRTWRRRQIRPRLDRLGPWMAALYTRPARQSVPGRLHRLASSVDATIAAAARMTAAQERLARQLESVSDVARAPHSAPSGPAGRAPAGSGSLSMAAGLTAAALVLAAGNTWLLDGHLLPAVLAGGAIPLDVLPKLWLAILFSSLALVLGLAHFVLSTAGRSIALRLAGVLAGMLLVVQGGLQAAATVVATQAWAGAVTDSWAGMAALVLVAGAGGLAPVLIGATAHASGDRFAQWIVAREERAAVRSARSRGRMADRLETAVHEVSRGMASVRAETGAIPADDPARLLVYAPDAASVERLALVLRRVAHSVERDSGPVPTGAVALAARHLADLGALALWLVAAAASLAIAAPAAGAVMAGGGLSGLVMAGVAGALLTLLVGGLLLRVLLDRPGRAADPRAGAAAILLLTVAAFSLAMGLGAFAATQPPFHDHPLGVAALLTVLLLAAALSSIWLPAGIRTGGNACRLAAGGTAWATLTLADLVLELADLALTGRSGRVRRGRRATQRASEPPREPAARALGGGPDSR
jgi:hypothetical protein